MPVQQKEQAEAAKKAAATKAPKGFDAGAFVPEEDLPEFTVVTNEEKEKPQVGEKVVKDYAPSERVLNALEKLPKDDLKSELGLDIDYLIKNTKRYGVLEGLAFGSFTTQPVFINPRRAEHQKFGRGGFFASVRISAWTGEDGQMKWNYEVHPVKMVRRFVRDEKGELIKNNDGSYRSTYEIDNNPLQPDEVLSIDGKPLSPEQMNQLRLTGMLCELHSTIGFNHMPVNELVDVNPLNNHELIRKNADLVAKRLNRDPHFKFKGVTYDLSPRQIDAIVMRKGCWLGEKTNAVFVQYDCAQEKLVPAVSYDRAVKAQLEQNKGKQQGEAQEQTQSKSKGPRVGR